MSDRDVKITITGRNASKPAFDEATRDVNRLGRESTTIADQMKSMLMPTLGGLGKAFAGAFAVGSIVAAGKQLLDFAGDLTDLSVKLGMSTTSIQKFQLAFDPAGVSIDTVGRSAAELANRIVSGDKSTVATLQKLGLTADALKKMSMEDMFITAADAVGGLQNKAEQIYASKTLFGKGGVELLAGLDGKLRETTDSFESMGLIIDSQTVKAADDFGDQLGLMGKQLLGIVGNIVGPLLPALSGLASLLSKIAGVVGDVIGFLVKMGTVLVGVVYGGIMKMLSGLAEASTKIPIVGKHLGFMGDAAEWLGQQSAGAFTHVKDLVRGTEEAGNAAAGAAPRVLGFGDAADEAAKKAAKAAAENQKLADSMRAVAEEAIVDINFAEFERGREQAELLRLELTRLGGISFAKPIADLGLLQLELRGLEAILPGVRVIGEAIPQALTPPPSRWDSFFGDLSATIRKGFGPTIMAAITGGGDVGQSIGAFLGESITKNLFKDGGLGAKLQEGVAGLFGKSGMGKWMGEAISSFLPGIGGLLTSFIGPLVGKLGSLIKGMFQSEETKKVNQPRDKFFEDAGGFEGLAASLGQVVDGVTAEKLIAAVYDAKTEEAFNRAKKAILDLIGPLDSVRAASAATGAAAARGFTDVDAEVQTLIAAVGTSDRGLAAELAGLSVRIRDAAASGITDFSAFGNEVERLRSRVEDVTGAGVRGFEDVWRTVTDLDAAIGEDQHGLSRELDVLQQKIEDAARAGVTDFSEFGAAIDDIKARMAEPVEFTITPKLGDEQWFAAYGGSRQAVRNLIEDFIRGNPDDWKRIPSALGIPLEIAMAAMGAEWGRKYHTGGILRAHTGMFIGQRLGSDEVPIIAQTGEGILSRRGMAALGGPGVLQAMNGGGSSLAQILAVVQQLAARPIQVALYVSRDAGGKLRLDESDRRAIQDWLYAGGLNIPQRSIAAGAR